MSGHRPWREVKAEKERRDRERGRTPARSHQHEPGEPCDETCHELADRFIYTRGPHEGQPIDDPDHVCVPECYEDQSHMLADATYVDPQPLSAETRRRALSWLRAGAPSLVVTTGWYTTQQRDAHAHVELYVDAHPSVDLERVKLRLIEAVTRLNDDLQREWLEQRSGK